MLGTAALTLAAALAYISHATPIEIERNIIDVVTALFVVAMFGWLFTTSDGRRRRDLVAGKRELTRGQAELRQGQAVLQAQLAELRWEIEQLRRALRQRPAVGTCSPGRLYLSRTAGPVGIQASTVDSGTEPADARLQQAREAGIEEGFDIGLRTRLADLGVPTLPRPRRP
ncbi:hypothetical protein C1I95_12540 [Micromonospora craterilacus]|uniref:Uncharacterized protein n=2 Tax=Micromonospora craterilacus TaxID=1655439 RepID=A0A2W2FBM1_9ACTN|nr:hypothetical protein C1I95_12540 [Micromonospora craterilacus]